ncbi:MAG TPA: polyphenol oxidase family protein [Ilumatobacter sp.]
MALEHLELRRRRFVDLPWTQLDQRHGSAVVRVVAPGGADGVAGDVAITALDDAVLGCWAADCAPLVLIGRQAEFAVVHAGWRGIAGGVVQAACTAFREPVVRAVLGPTIGPCCYEFGTDDLEAVAAGAGTTAAAVRGSTTAGGIALDVPAAVRAAVGSVCGAVPFDLIAGCTGCRHPGFSHRVRREAGRHVIAVWQTAGPCGCRSGGVMGALR